MQPCCILKNSFIFCLLLLLNPLISVSQGLCHLSVTGVVLDELKNPLPGATVFITELNQGVVTDLNGMYTFSGLCSGHYIFEIKFLGYQSQQIKIDLNKSERIETIMKTEDRLLSEVIIADHPEPVGKASNYGSLSGKSLEEIRGKSLGESLQSITGVNTIQSGPAIFKPVIHGVHSQRILILNNGVRQEGQQWGAEHAPEIDPFIASNLVVVKDAGAIKYGTDALGGVVILTPAELPTSQSLGGEFHLIGSGNGKAGIASGLLEGGVANHKGWGWRIQGTAKRSGDLHTPDYNLSNTGFQELNYSASTGFHKNGRGLEVYYSHFGTTIGILRGSVVGSSQDLITAMEQEPPQNTRPFTYQISQPRQAVKHDLLKLTSHVRKGSHLFNVQYALQINNRQEFDLRRGTLADVPALGYKLYTQTVDAEWENTIEKSHIRSFGLNGMVQDNNKINGTQNIPFIPNFVSYSVGLFWMEKLSINNWDWEVGARYDLKYYNIVGFDYRNELYRSKLNYNNVSATLGGTKKLNEVSSLTTTLGSTWRPPSVSELYSLGTHQSAASIEYGLMLDQLTNEVIPPDEINLKVEQAIKLVSTYRLEKGKLDAELSGYLNYIFNYIYLRPAGVTKNTRGIFPYFRYTQTDASFLGLDVSLSYSITRRLKANSRISMLRATDVANNDYLIFIPSSRYEVSMRYDLPVFQSLTNPYFEIRLKYVTRQNRAPRVVPMRDIVDAKEQGIDLFENDKRNFDFVSAPDGYFLGSLTAGISRPIKNSKLDFRLSVDNLTNTAYREYSNRMRYYADDIGRNISFALKYSF